jgi:predicted nucleic acid-binding protein
MPGKVLDSFALLAYFRDEPGAEAVENLLVAASRKDTALLMTEVNYAEVKYCLIKKDGQAAWQEAANVLPGLPIAFHPATRELADMAADLKSRVSFSLADAFAAALARRHKADLVTGDLEFKAVEKEIRIHWLA